MSIEEGPNAKTLRSQVGVYWQGLSGMLATLVAVLLVSLLFFSQGVAAIFSRK